MYATVTVRHSLTPAWHKLNTTSIRSRPWFLLPGSVHRQQPSDIQHHHSQHLRHNRKHNLERQTPAPSQQRPIRDSSKRVHDHRPDKDIRDQHANEQHPPRPQRRGRRRLVPRDYQRPAGPDAQQGPGESQDCDAGFQGGVAGRRGGADEACGADGEDGDAAGGEDVVEQDEYEVYL